MTPVTDILGTQGSPWRLQAFSVSAAYHTWLGKASRPQTLSFRIADWFWSCGLRAFWERLCFSISVLLYSRDWMTGCRHRPFLPLLFCELPAGSHWITHAAWHAFSQLRSATEFFFPSIFHIRGSDSPACIWDLKRLGSRCSVFVKFLGRRIFLPHKYKYWNRMLRGSPGASVWCVCHRGTIKAQMFQAAHLPWW